MDHEIHIGTETLVMLPERGLYWQRTHTLFIADTHFGQPVVRKRLFRPQVATNQQVMADDLERLSRVLARVEARRLMVLGDLFHAPAGFDAASKAAFGAWRRTHAHLPITLINGNHDVFTLPDDWQIQRVDGPTPGPYFVLMHVLEQPAQGFGLAGHLHPSINEKTSAGIDVNVPCYWFVDDVCVLPAFSSIARLAQIYPGSNSRVFMAKSNAILPYELAP